MKPHKHAELIKAWADGAEIECKFLSGVWRTVDYPDWANPDEEYRIKPEPKPDYCRYIVGDRESNNWEEYSVAQELWDSKKLHKPQIRITFDGETGELKSAEVLK